MGILAIFLSNVGKVYLHWIRNWVPGVYFCHVKQVSIHILLFVKWTDVQFCSRSFLDLWRLPHDMIFFSISIVFFSISISIVNSNKSFSNTELSLQSCKSHLGDDVEWIVTFKDVHTPIPEPVSRLTSTVTEPFQIWLVKGLTMGRLSWIIHVSPV